MQIRIRVFVIFAFILELNESQLEQVNDGAIVQMQIRIRVFVIVCVYFGIKRITIAISERRHHRGEHVWRRRSILSDYLDGAVVQVRIRIGDFAIICD